jgi:hypothetical protein
LTFRFALKERKFPDRRFVEFPWVKGKTAEKIQLFTSSSDHVISIEFDDGTNLSFDIEPGFTVDMAYDDRKIGDIGVLKEWPPIRSKGLRTRAPQMPLPISFGSGQPTIHRAYLV